MIYLKREQEQFELTKKSFGEAYAALLKEMAEVADAKGRVRDTSSPIHHRMSPATMLALLQAKGRRVETLITAPVFKHGKIIEECTDMANYALFIGALCVLLAKEEAENAERA